MEKDINQIKKNKNLRNKEKQNRIVVFFVFIIIATLSWFIRALNEEYVTDVKYPVKYINYPKDKLLSEEPPEKLVLRIQADGYTILNSKLMPKKKLEFDVNSFSLNSSDADSSVFYILTKYAREVLSIELAKKNEKVNIIDIAPDTIFFKFTDLVHKKIAVKANLSQTATTFRQQYTFNGPIKINPDTILVTGPIELIDTLQYIYTVPIVLKDLSDSLEKTYQINKIDKIIYDYKKVELTIPVDRYTEASFQVPLSIRNVPDSYKVKKIFPKYVTISVLVTLSHYNDLTEDNLEPYLDFRNIDPDLDSRVSVSIDSLPNFIHSVKINPRNVEFLFEETNLQTVSNEKDSKN